MVTTTTAMTTATKVSRSQWRLAAALPVRLALIVMHNLRVDNGTGAFDQLNACAEDYADLYPNTAPGDIPGVQNARQFFRAIGIDPTKRRPSSEALLNRALKKKELYSVNTLVDVGNWCSLDFLLPTCIYDADKIEGDVEIRLGRPGESYLALNDREMEFAGRFLLADQFGPFGSPMTDSLRTAVSTATTNAVLGIWAPLSLTEQHLRRKAETFAERTRRFCGGLVDRIETL